MAILGRQTDLVAKLHVRCVINESPSRDEPVDLRQRATGVDDVLHAAIGAL